jgi:hypothetical protein
VARLRAAVQTGQMPLPYSLLTIERFLCDACMVAYDLEAKEQAYVQRKAAEELQRLEVRVQQQWQRLLTDYERGTGTPASDFQTLRDILTHDERQRYTTMPYPEFLQTHYW